MSERKFRTIDINDPLADAAKESSKRWKQAEGLQDFGSKLGKLLDTEFYSVSRDAVEFPSGMVGTYLRVEMANEVGRPVAALVMHNNEIVLMEQERYPASAVVLETPRGFGRSDESSVESLNREVKEEIGSEIIRQEYLGSMFTNTGLSNEYVDLYFVEVESVGVSKEDGVRRILHVNLEEIENMMARGNFKDPFFMSAYSIAKARKLL